MLLDHPATGVRIWNGLGFAVAPLLLGMLGYHRRWVSDDAFISFRVARHLAAGYGPVFNVDERVEAHTNLLWVLLLAIWDVFGGRIEHGAVIWGIAFSVVGIVMAQIAALRLSERAPDDTISTPDFVVPFGALVFAVLPVSWDFVTSGLETGMTFAWLGAVYWIIIRVTTQSTASSSLWLVTAAAALGLGPLIRPDLGLFSAVFFAAFVMCLASSPSWRFTGRHATILMGSFVAIPLTYQVFRMGYYAALVPNTAIAKAAGGARWAFGRDYLLDLAQPYLLWLPLALVVGWTSCFVASAIRTSAWTTVVLIVAPVLAGLIHALYIVRMGGDFMHGRLLLPSLFALVLPVAVVRIPASQLRRRAGIARAVTVASIAIWGGVAALALRIPPEEAYALIYVADERSFYVRSAGHPHPITLDDFGDFDLSWLRQGREWQALAQRDTRTLVIHPDLQILRNELPPSVDVYPLSPAVSDAIGVVAPAWNIGMSGYAAGPHVHIVDRYGLADPIAARVTPIPDGRPGHTRALRLSWVIARYADPAADVPVHGDVIPARVALGCDQLAKLIDAVEEPLTPRRFVENLWKSWQFTWLEIPSEPVVAESELCEFRGTVISTGNS